MEPRKTSFIPKKMYNEPGVAPRHGTTVSIFSLIAIVVFIVALAGSGGVFFYHKVLVQRLEDLNNQLIAEKNAFEPDTIEEVITLSHRIESVKAIFSQHTVLHPIFELLSEKTYKSVQFTDFSYSTNNQGEGGGIKVTLQGTAKSFESVALQSDVFGKEKYLKSPVFTELKLDKNGNVNFTFSAIVLPEFLAYSTPVSAGVENQLSISNHE